MSESSKSTPIIFGRQLIADAICTIKCNKNDPASLLSSIRLKRNYRLLKHGAIKIQESKLIFF